VDRATDERGVSVPKTFRYDHPICLHEYVRGSLRLAENLTAQVYYAQ
jgi:hypothetical protein